ncbi:hypothetical protein FHX57_006723 [Paraburkholderia tropica]|uniref:hypothetical protein n=1 Tax=Paraburkholderia tropica TaxID=92647 RepID=UPI00161CC121|nr:hypothetical protein [Paraburkholderia tropica]MBB3004341.1 hypothetical protein [Paraburkholderia tropica]
MSSLSISIGGQVTTVQIGNLSPAVQAQLTSAIATINTIQQSSLLNWAYGNIFRLVSATRDSNEAIVTASIIWPDGATGTFTTDVASTAFPGAIDAWHATYVNGSVSHTITQPAVTRDANGAVIAQPAITIT